MTRAEQSNYWRGMREDKVTKQQKQGLAVPNPDSMNPAKPLIKDKYNNMMELKKPKSINHFTKALL